MKFNRIPLIVIISLISMSTWGQTVPYSKGRIAMSSDGNAHDPDDWGATVASLGIISSRNLQDKLSLYTYADHVWSSKENHMTQITKSAITGGIQFGFDVSRFIPAVDNPEIAYGKMKDEIIKSTSENPLTIIAAGPMQVVGEALSLAQKENSNALKYIRVISHSKSNNQHADRPSKNEKPHEGWHWDELKKSFSSDGVVFDLILDQNDKKNKFVGFSSNNAGKDGKADWSVWNFLKGYNNHSIRVNNGIQLIYTQMKASHKADISDAGMLYYLFTGDVHGGPEKLKAIFDNGFIGEKDFQTIFNGQNFEGWNLKIRNGDSELAKKVFAIEDEHVHVFNDEFPARYQLGGKDWKKNKIPVNNQNRTHGLFYSKKKYSKYILRFEYKWGSNIANNFIRWQYDAGLYYHVVDDKVWPKGIEYQVRFNHLTNQNHTGDFFTGGAFTWFANEEGTKFVSPKHGGKKFENRKRGLIASSPKNFHALDGEWNYCEVIVMGNEYTIHKLNGEIVNMATDLPFSEGIIGFQSETAEVFYRNIEIKEFDKIVPIDEILKE
ncbi:3-keto-disaccharide hydrolase [Lutibacter citreus]|uniref:3-keto-disaccharide hydrolase n=1 Tax=Lutibacter citreus TaxID=2138210 RepID=UPI000DBE1D78|nr:DUF1080 domain-containing protein [Lutibacter citreus]